MKPLYPIIELEFCLELWRSNFASEIHFASELHFGDSLRFGASLRRFISLRSFTSEIRFASELHFGTQCGEIALLGFHTYMYKSCQQHSNRLKQIWHIVFTQGLQFITHLLFGPDFTVQPSPVLWYKVSPHKCQQKLGFSDVQKCLRVYFPQILESRSQVWVCHAVMIQLTMC